MNLWLRSPAWAVIKIKFKPPSVFSVHYSPGAPYPGRAIASLTITDLQQRGRRGAGLPCTRIADELEHENKRLADSSQPPASEALPQGLKSTGIGVDCADGLMRAGAGGREEREA